MTKQQCPYCHNQFEDLDEHLRRAFGPHDPHAPLEYKDSRTGEWRPIEPASPAASPQKDRRRREAESGE